MAAFLTLLVILLGSSTAIFALFEDEVGVWDWHKRYIGRVKYAVFHTSSKGKKQVIVTTEQNVVASLNVRNGEIFWRHVLGDFDKIEGLDIVYGKYAITLSGGNILRAWNINDGHLIWETYLYPFMSPPILNVTPIEIHHLKSKMIVVFGGSIIQGISSIDGDILWTSNTSSTSQGGRFRLKKILSGEDKNSLYGVGFTGTAGFSVWKVYLFTGRLVMQEAATIKGNICTDELVVTKHTIIALDCEGKVIYTGHIGPNQSFFVHKTLVTDIIPDAFGKARLLEATLEGVFSLRFVDKVVFVKIGSSDHDLEVMEKFERPAVISNTLELPLNKTALMVAQHMGSSLEHKLVLRVILKEGEKDQTSSQVVDLELDRGLVQQVHLGGYIRSDMSYGFRALLIAEDYSLSLAQQGEILWTREEGLAAIIDAATVELPKENGSVLPHKADSRLSAWFSTEYNFRFLKFALQKSLVDLSAPKNKMRGRIDLTQDIDGFRKLLIVLTKGGKILALHTETGGIIWSLFSPLFQKISRKSKAIAVRLFLCYHPKRSVYNKNPIILVIGRSSTGLNASGCLIWIDAYTGTEIYSTVLTYPVDQVLPLDYMTSASERLYLLVDLKKKVHLFPRTEESLSIIKNERLNIHFPMIDLERGIAVGRVVDIPRNQDSENNTSEYVFSSNRIWMVSFSQKQEKILATSVSRRCKVSGGNQFVYHFYDSKSCTYKLATLEFTETIDKDYAIASTLMNAHEESARSIRVSHSWTVPIAHSVKTMAVPETSSSVTKQWLIGTVGGQIISLDAREIEQSRSGTVYGPKMNYSLKQSYLTHNTLVEGLQNIIIVPGGYGSKSLVFAYGVDIFFTRAVHNYTSHSLLTGYTYCIVLITVGAMLMAIFVTKIFSQQRRSKIRWKTWLM